MRSIKSAQQIAADRESAKKRRAAAEELIRPLLLVSTKRRIALSLSTAIDEALWRATPVHRSARTRDGILLLALAEAIFVADFARRSFEGPVKAASPKQLGAVKFQAKQLVSALRDLPPDVRWALLNSVRFRPTTGDGRWPSSRLAEVEEDFLPRLDRLSAAAGQRIGKRGIGPTARELKMFIEDEIAFTLALHGIELTTNPRGALDNTLRVAWDHLEIRAGGHPHRTLKKLIHKWQPGVVKEEANRREASAFLEAEIGFEAAMGLESETDLLRATK